MKQGFLKTVGRKIVDANGKEVSLRGVNLGGWLMMEAYFMHAPSLPEQKFKKEFKKALGEKALVEFEQRFREAFITEKDIANIKKLGFNCLRVPFNCRLIETKPYHYDENGVKYLDRVIAWAKKYQIWLILDLHAAPGSQNHEWHSDSYGKPELWTKLSNQKRTVAIWKFLADRYKDETTVAGYDLLNEAVLKDSKILNRLYQQIIKTIRSVDRNHILFIEGNTWAMDLDCLDRFEDDNYVLSMHHYIPLEFTFSLIQDLHYPLNTKDGKWSKAISKKYLQKYQKISKDRDVPIFVGEFGVNYREGYYGEDLWLEHTLQCFDELDFHWTYWPYKAIKNHMFPDGVYSYYPNPAWVARQGPVTGWDTYKNLWTNHKEAMVKSWDTDNFTANTKVVSLLKRYAKSAR